MSAVWRLRILLSVSVANSVDLDQIEHSVLGPHCLSVSRNSPSRKHNKYATDDFSRRNFQMIFFRSRWAVWYWSTLFVCKPKFILDVNIYMQRTISADDIFRWFVFVAGEGIRFNQCQKWWPFKGGALVIYISCLFLLCCLGCLLLSCDHLLGNVWSHGFLVCDVFSCFCHFPIWCPGPAVVLVCIYFWS